jgi:glycerol-3-phosphate acyltransferase PlsX
MEMVLTGRRVDAAEAHAMGFVNRVAGRNDWFAAALELAQGAFTSRTMDAVDAVAGSLGALDAERDKARHAIQALISHYDYSATGGAPLLGIDGICIICHGSSGDRAIKNALGIAARYAKAKLNELIVQELESSPPAPADEE